MTKICVLVEKDRDDGADYIHGCYSSLTRAQQEIPETQWVFDGIHYDAELWRDTSKDGLDHKYVYMIYVMVLND